MKGLSKREVTMLVSLLIVLSIAVYYQFYLKDILTSYTAVSTEISDTINQINDAKIKQGGIELSEKKILEITDELEQYKGVFQDGFDRSAVLRMLDSSVRPYVSDYIISFSPNYQMIGSNYVYTVDLSFKVTKSGFSKVLNNLRGEPMINRIIESTLRVSDFENGTYIAGLSVEMMTGIPTQQEK